MDDKLIYLGHASLKIITRESKVIYIDPFAGEESYYQTPADLILVTHDHYDHNDISKIKNRSDDTKIITHNDALINGEYKTFNLGYANIEAVEAGYNKFHDKKVCVGYIITLSSGISIYIAGDTSTTPQMSTLSKYQLDYAFFPTDGYYTMPAEEATQAANIVQAKQSIPYHMTAADKGDFSQEVANKFSAENKLVIQKYEEIIL